MDKEIKLVVEEEKHDGKFKPVELSDSTVVSFDYTVNGGNRKLYIKAEKDGNEVGRLSLNPDVNRMFLQVHPLDSMTPEAVVEFMATAMAALEEINKR